MNTQSKAFLHTSKSAWERVDPKIERQIMGYDGRVMMVKVRFASGGIGTPHSHPHSQVTHIESGVFEVTIDGATETLKAGDGFYVAPDLVHGAICKEAGVLIDVFTPLREDFL